MKMKKKAQRTWSVILSGARGTRHLDKINTTTEKDASNRWLRSSCGVNFKGVKTHLVGDPLGRGLARLVVELDAEVVFGAAWGYNK
jgi:hypothetical protein